MVGVPLAGTLLGPPLHRNQLVVLRIKSACPAPELKGKAGPERRVAAAGIKVPAFAPRGPDGTPHPLLYLLIEYFLTLWPNLDRPQGPPLHHAQTVQNVCEL